MLWNPFKKKPKQPSEAELELAIARIVNIGVARAIRGGAITYLGRNTFLVGEMGFMLDGSFMRTNDNTYPILDQELYECLHMLTTEMKPVTIQ